jgi:hypothetical protein
MPNQYSEVVAREIRLILPYDDPKLAYVRSRQAPYSGTIFSLCS